MKAGEQEVPVMGVALGTHSVAVIRRGDLETSLHPC